MRGLHHNGYWTDDLAAATAQAERLFGVGPFQVLAHVDLGDSGPARSATSPGPPATFLPNASTWPAPAVPC